MHTVENIHISQAEIDAQELWDNMKGFRVTNKHRKKCCRVALRDRIEDLQGINLSEDSSVIEARIEHWQQVLVYIEKK